MGTHGQEFEFRETIPTPDEQTQIQIQEVNPELERYYLYERDAPQDQHMEEQWETCGVAGAAETFLLPNLRRTSPYPPRCHYIGPMGWDLVDPEGKVEPFLIATTYDHRRFLVGLASWSDQQSRTLHEHWEAMAPDVRTYVERSWRHLIAEAKTRA